MREALQALLDRYTSLVNCGDCGNWDPEKEPCVVAARAALAHVAEAQPFVRWEFLPEQPTHAMLKALAGEPLLLVASDEQELRARYLAMLQHCPCPGGPKTIGECNAASECGCSYGVEAKRTPMNKERQ